MPDQDASIELAIPQLGVTVQPENGCGITSMRVRSPSTGEAVELLWSPPWTTRGRGPFPTGSRMAWTRAYQGGWATLLPHAGAERDHRTAPFGFHGEAALVAWDVEGRSPTGAVLSTRLMTAPLHVHRTLTVGQPGADDRAPDADADGVMSDDRLDASLTVADVVTNESPDPTSFSWGHHPTFGEQFVDDSTRIVLGSATLQTDPTSPIGGERGGAIGRWPRIGDCDLSVIPPASERRAALGYLSGLSEGRYRIINQRHRLGVEVSWPLEVFPFLWLWQEFHGTADFPWFRRAYAFALEPHSTVPEGGPPSITLQPGQSIAATVTARVFHVPSRS